MRRRAQTACCLRLVEVQDTTSTSHTDGFFATLCISAFLTAELRAYEGDRMPFLTSVAQSSVEVTPALASGRTSDDESKLARERTDARGYRALIRRNTSAPATQLSTAPSA